MADEVPFIKLQVTVNSQISQADKTHLKFRFKISNQSLSQEEVGSIFNEKEGKMKMRGVRNSYDCIQLVIR